MRVLQISGYESPGMRFNGITLAPLLRSHDVESTHMIWMRDTKDPAIVDFERPHARELNALAARVEDATSLQSILFTNAPEIVEKPAFQAADIVHLHLIHTGYFSLMDLPLITSRKPTVWTLHDPWALTGHCIYPFDCARWMKGCGHCPDLATHFPMRKDNTALMFDLKREAYGRSDFDVIVASTWMRGMVERSPLFRGVNVHQIPFGLDLPFFSAANGSEIRARHGIPDDSIVLCFRAQANFKGLDHIIQALDAIQSDRSICLLTVGNPGMLARFSDRFQLVELGWVDDPIVLRDALGACDIFLMPSTAEAFGVMAIEAMACGKPVICFSGTALPEVTGAPEIGIAVPSRDAAALARAIQHLVDRPEERENRGRAGQALARREYSDRVQARRTAEVYASVMDTRGWQRLSATSS
jgi:glycosyltransferase involved in cell wall biosynthesis